MKKIVYMKQVHGNRVVRVSKKDGGRNIEKCDGLIKNDPKVELCIKVADCLPIFMTDLSSDSVGLVHAGWRGLEKEILKNAINLMHKEFGTEAAQMGVYIGPHICQKHYEVQTDVSKKFKDYPKAVKAQGDKEFLDLALVAKQQLIDLGVKSKNIKIAADCTFESEVLYSYRRDKTENRNKFLFGLNI
jgi:YfiH family protein